MNFLRLCLVALAFLAFPLALIIFADITVVERELPGLLGETAREAASSPETQAEFAADLGNLWIEENPQIAARLTEAGLDPETAMADALEELSGTDAFAAELERAAAAYGVDLVEGTAPQITFDLAEAIRESGINFDPAVVESLNAFSAIETTPLENQEALRFSEWIDETKQMSGYVTLGAMLLLLLVTRSARHHFGALFFVGMPVLFLQRFLLQEIAADPDPVDALVGRAILETWLPWTHLMMAISAGSLVVLLASYKLFPRNEFNTVPYAKNTGFVPERPVKTAAQTGHTSQSSGADNYDWSGDNDHRGLRELSIVED